MSFRFKRAREESLAKQDGKKKPIDWLLLLVPLVVPFVIPFLVSPVLYVFGSSSQRGFLEGFGIWSNNFPLDTHQTYMQAISGSLWTLAVWGEFFQEHWLRIIFAGSVLCAYFFVCYWGLYKLEQFAKRRTASSGKKPASSKTSDWRGSGAAGALRVAFGIIVVPLGAIAVLMLIGCVSGLFGALGELGGNANAENLMKYYKKHGCRPTASVPWSVCVKVIDSKNEGLASGLFIARSPKEIAVYDVDHSVVLALPDEYRIENAPDTATVAKTASAPTQSLQQK